MYVNEIKLFLWEFLFNVTHILNTKTYTRSNLIFVFQRLYKTLEMSYTVILSLYILLNLGFTEHKINLQKLTRSTAKSTSTLQSSTKF